MELQIFNFETIPVRTLVGDSGDPWWFAADVCRVLTIANPRDAVSRLDDDEKGVAIADTPGGPQELATVNESGLYSLILKSRKPEAKRFKRWVTHEVLPAIRKTGRYEVPRTASAVPAVDPRLAQAEAIVELVRHQIETERRLEETRQELATVRQESTTTLAIATDATAKASHALDLASGSTGYMTTRAYFKVKRIRGPRADAQKAGVALRKMCLAEGIDPRWIPDESHGEVRVWPVELLDRWYASLPGPAATSKRPGQLFEQFK